MITAVVLLMAHNAFRLERSDLYVCAKPVIVRMNPEVTKLSLKIRQLIATKKCIKGLV